MTASRSFSSRCSRSSAAPLSQSIRYANVSLTSRAGCLMSIRMSTTRVPLKVQRSRRVTNPPGTTFSTHFRSASSFGVPSRMHSSRYSSMRRASFSSVRIAGVIRARAAFISGDSSMSAHSTMTILTVLWFPDFRQGPLPIRVVLDDHHEFFQALEQGLHLGPVQAALPAPRLRHVDRRDGGRRPDQPLHLPGAALNQLRLGPVLPVAL